MSKSKTEDGSTEDRKVPDAATEPTSSSAAIKDEESEDEQPLARRSVKRSKVQEALDDSDDDVPLAKRVKMAKTVLSDEDDDKPLAQLRVKKEVKVEESTKKTSSSQKAKICENKKPVALRKTTKVEIKEEVEESSKGKRSSTVERKTSRVTKKAKVEEESTESGSGEEEDEEEEEDDEDEEEEEEEDNDEDNVPLSQRFGKKNGKPIKEEKQKRGKKSSKTYWTTLEHNGVIFPPPYQPHGVKMLYEGKPVGLTPEQEEVATMFAVMRDTDYATKQKFRENFWTDWKLLLGKDHVIKKLEPCDFTPIYEWHLQEKERKKQMSNEEKKKIREEKVKAEEKYTWAIVDGVKEKVGNFRVEPPGLFRGRGEHPKMGKLKKRVYPEDIVINIGKEAQIPECPMPGHKWKEVRNDNHVTWLAYWDDPLSGKEKYVFLHQSSSWKAQSDKEKYEKARMLKDHIKHIREAYTKDFANADATKRQIAVATYLIDKLALRAGNEKDDDEADTVGCCSLKVDNIALKPPRTVEFDFLGKDSIRYFNSVEVDERVYKALATFRAGKKAGEDLFDLIDTTKLNNHLKGFMPGLTAKVFRTYNASITLDELLAKNTTGKNLPELTGDYNTANKQVAILCNHQRTVSKAHGAQMEKLEAKMTELKTLREELVEQLAALKAGKPLKKEKKDQEEDSEGKTKKKKDPSPEQLEKKIDQVDKRVAKIELDMRIKDDLKTVALGTSKINYLDPRITVAWCKRHEVPIDKIFNKSLLQKFAWAMDVEPEFRF